MLLRHDYALAERRGRGVHLLSMVCGAWLAHPLGDGEGAPAGSSSKVVDYPLAPSSRDDVDAPVRLALIVVLGKQVSPATQSCREIEIDFFG